MPAIKYTKTSVNTEDAWSASKAEKAIRSDAGAATLRKEYAWVDPDGDPDTKGAYKFPHHFVSDDGTVGAASSKACSAGIAALNGGRGGADIPDADRQAIYNHLAHHLKDADLEPPKLNSFDEDEHHTAIFSLTENSFVPDDESSTLQFPMGQVVSDDTTQRNGTSYDIPSMDLSEFNGSITADHAGSIGSIIGKTKLRKRGNQVVMDSIQFATKENPLAQVAYDLYKNGFAKDWSIETYGPPEDETGCMYNAKLCGLSAVVVGNNKSATMNALVRNSLAEARKNGLDITEAEQSLGVEVPAISTNSNVKQEQESMFVTVENSRDFAIKVTYKSAAGKEVATELAPGASVDVSDDQKDAVEKQINDAKNVVAESETITKAVNAALDAREKQFQERQEAFEKKVLEGLAKEPEWHADSEKRHVLTGNQLEDMGWEERTVKQMQSLDGMLRGDPEASKFVWAANKFNLEEIKKTNPKYNALSLSDLGNFVIPPELITKIFGHVSNFQPLLDAFNFQETLSLITSYITRTGELDMQDVQMADDHSTNNDLKSLSEPTYSTHTANLMEFASVTPVDSSALRFSAADIMQDVTSMYKRAYDRALARSIIGRLELAVQSNGQSEAFNITTGNDGPIGALTSLLDIWTPIVEWVPDGVFLMTRATQLQLMKYALEAGPNGPLSNIFTTGERNVPMFFNLPYVIVPSAVMPSLNNATGSQPSWTFEGQAVTATHAILLANPDNFMGRVSGGLNFQVSAEAAYEENGVVKSAYQRDKLVFRGYGYRKSAVTLPTDVAGVTSNIVS
jgi:HK97 family phage major capsid protein